MFVIKPDVLERSGGMKGLRSERGRYGRRKDKGRKGSVPYFTVCGGWLGTRGEFGRQG